MTAPEKAKPAVAIADSVADAEGAAPQPVARRRRGRSVEKTEETRTRLIRAAADVIGEIGYAKATIARITERAQLALGTFYTYFASRQDLFDQLLPLLGKDMLDYIRDNMPEDTDVLVREEAGFRLYVEYMIENPGFYRLLNEAETMAPKAYQEHFRNLTNRYVRSIRRGWERGELPGYDERELEVVVYILMSARNYLTMRYGRDGKRGTRVPDWVIEGYMKFVRGGLRPAGA